MKLTIEIDQAVLDVYNEMEGDLYSEEMKAGFAFKLMKFEFEKKIVKAVMDSYKEGGEQKLFDYENATIVQKDFAPKKGGEEC